MDNDHADVAALREAAEAWCRFEDRSLAGETKEEWADDPDWWAVEFWMTGGEVWEDEESVRVGLLALIDAAPDHLLGLVGAGPLETFIDTDESRLRWIEEHAAASARFRRALAHVWTWGSEPDDVAARIERAAGVPLPRPPEEIGR